MASARLVLASSQVRTEDETRRLAGAMHDALRVWKDLKLYENASASRDEEIDLIIETEKAWQKYMAAKVAFDASVKIDG